MIELAQCGGFVVTCARNAHDFLGAVALSVPSQTIISLDHDLNAPPGERDPGTGMDVVRSIADRLDFAGALVHSSNDAAASAMFFHLRASGWRRIARVVPYGDLDWIGEAWIEKIRELARA